MQKQEDDLLKWKEVYDKKSSEEARNENRQHSPPEAREKLKQSFFRSGPSGVAELEEFKTLAVLPGWGWSKLLRSWDGMLNAE